MSSSQAGNVVDILGPAIEKVLADGNIHSYNIPRLDMDSTDLRNLEKEFQLSSSDILGSPRDRRDTTDVLNYHGKKASQPRKEGAHRSPIIHPLVTNKPSSSIPLPVKSPKSPPSKVPSQPLSRSINRSSRPSSVTLNRTSQVTNKHTLEIQFINKKKRLGLLKKDLVEKQKPVLDLYQNLLQIKRRLEELGKVVQLEEVKLMPYNEIQDSAAEVDGRGENISPEVVVGMQSSIEEIPKTLMEICKNLLSRRAVIVDLLESVTKSEVDVGDLSDKIETLKVEGTQLQNNLDAIISEHEKKINELVINWQALLNDKKSMNTNSKIEDLEDKLKAQDKLTQESNQVILDLQRKLDDKRSSHEKSVAELNNVIYTLKEQIIRLEQELEGERKAAADFKNRNTTNAQNSKMLRNKITELENDKKTNEATNSDLSKKVKLLQDQIKHKEAQWGKEKEELSKNLKHQENLLQKLTADKNKFETRLEEIEGEKMSVEEVLQNDIDALRIELDQVKDTLSTLSKEKEEATERCKEMEEYIAKMGLECRETMNMVSSSIEWGKDIPGTVTEAQKYSQYLVKDIMIRECQDKIKELEKENHFHKETIALVENSINNIPTDTEKTVLIHHDVVTRYKQLLAESEQKLTEK